MLRSPCYPEDALKLDAIFNVSLMCGARGKKGDQKTLLAQVPFVSEEGESQHLDMMEGMINITSEND